ncbi:Pyocin large subunit [Leclercia adecarboxylata]|uniref:DnaT-like ssDNA-binding domain-containing protein n=1 Tax=Leclercia adecarboxylata TaxID=83655 RepID=UPI001E5018E1|nr:DnaT-like ssDNA-binding domain-containing protein [Leclercia adecarboxylata]UFM71251.1 Pyocin large subunit [Leclercia adecarboxylata]
MAGDWIKMRADLHTHPKVVRIASALDADRLRVVGALHATWCLFDAHSVDGELEGYSPKTLNDMIGFEGFAQALITVGWLESTDVSLCMPRFSEHNGQSAKRRAQEADRKRNVRKMSASDADKKRTREEKRREDLNPSLNEGAEEKSEEGQPPFEPTAARYLEGLDEPIGKFTMTSAWLPSRDFRQRAAMWGIALPEPDYLSTELAEFASYWESEGKVFTQVQWEQKLARHVVLVRSKKQPETGGKDNAGVRGEPTASRAVQQIQSAHAEWRRRNGLDGNGNGVAPVAGHGGNILEPVDAEEWGGAVGALDRPDRFDD